MSGISVIQESNKYNMMENKIYNMDAMEFVKTLPDNSVDLIVTDPPYESLMRWAGIGTTARMGLGRKDSDSYDPEKFYKTISNDYLKDIVLELYRVLKNNCHAYVMCDPVTLPIMYKIYDESKFSNMKPLIWDKKIMGMGYHYRTRYEFIIMLDKGKNRRLNNLSISDILEYQTVGRLAKKVPTQKPLQLFEMLISQSSEEGELVLDPFLGSGTACIAAKNLNRKYIGSELDEEHFKIIQEALNVPNFFNGVC